MKGHISHIRTRKKFRFLICGETKYAKPDICIIDQNIDNAILLVQEDQHLGGEISPHCQLVAGAIAAFRYNNAQRRSVGLDLLTSMVIPGITLMATFPTFFKIPVTKELVRSVEYGQYPPTPTIVTAHVPVISNPDRKYITGMKSVENRLPIVQCYEAFKKFVFD